jgi:hypothetical protein
MGLTRDQVSFAGVKSVVPAKLRRLPRMGRLRRAAVSAPGRTRGTIPDSSLRAWIAMFAMLNGEILQLPYGWALAYKEKLLYASVVADMIGACQGTSHRPSAGTRL